MKIKPIQHTSRRNHNKRSRRTQFLIAFSLLATLASCAAGPSTSRVILSDASPIAASDAYEQAAFALDNGYWEMGNGLLLAALEKDPSLAQNKTFMRQLAESAKAMGIDDFHSEVYDLGVTQ